MTTFVKFICFYNQYSYKIWCHALEGWYLFAENWLAFSLVLLLWPLCLFVSEKDCCSASEHSSWINWYNRHMGTTRRRPSSVSLIVSSMLPWQIIYVYSWVSLFWFCVLLAQFGDYWSCFDDHNYFVKERAGYIVHKVWTFMILHDICLSKLCLLIRCLIS